MDLKDTIPEMYDIPISLVNDLLYNKKNKW